MRNVTRLGKPRSLVRNAARWTRELLEEIAGAASEGRKPQRKFVERYNKADVKNALAKMYGNRCCYCEAHVAVVSKGHIEHRKPKAAHRFPELAFEWKNLHLGCPNCNSAKGDQWDSQHEILDAVDDIPITNHLSYRLSEIGVLRDAVSPRGATTIRLCRKTGLQGLNREDLRQARTAILNPTMQIILELRRLGNAPSAVAKHDLLQAKVKGEYGSLIQFAIDGYLEN